MSKLRVDDIQSRTQQQTEQKPVEQVQKRTDLHARSAFDGTGPKTVLGIGKQDFSAVGKTSQPEEEAEVKPQIHRLRDGTEIEIPKLSTDDRNAALARLAQLSDEDREKMLALVIGLGGDVFDELRRNEGDVALTSKSQGLSSTAGETYDQWMVSTGQDQRDEAAESVLFVGMYGVEVNLENFMKEMVGREALADEVRADIRELESMLEDWPDDGSTELFSWREVKRNEDGSIEVIEHTNEPLTKEQARALLMQLEGSEGMLSGMATQDHFKLQHMTQKYQQAMNILSNILKSQDETRKGIIGNAKA